MTTPAGGSAPPLVTGEAVAVELRPAGIGSRGVALLIDSAIQLAASFLLALLAAAFAVHANTAAALAVILVLYVLLVLGYPVGFETLANGRTPGKMVLGLRVVRDDGGPIRFRHAFVRGLVGVVLDRPGLSFGLLSLIPMLFGARSKRLGDLAAGTIVVQERVPAKVAAPPPMPPALAAWAAGLDLSRVDDELAMRLRQFIARAGQLAPAVREELGSRLLAETASRTAAPPPAGVPGWAYLSAVLAERRRRELQRWQPVAPPVPSPPPPTVRRTPQPPATPPPPDGPFAPPQ
jgi:uncharacterized RDD family membrane protein YckC